MMTKTKSTIRKKTNEFEPYDLNGYKIIKPFDTHNAGTCQWTYCTKEKGGLKEEFFIKKFLAPKYPKKDAPISESQRERKIRDCIEWENKKRRLYNKIMSCANGNLVVPREFFRNDNLYYLVTDKIDSLSMTLKEMSEKSFEQKQIALRVLAHCVAMLSSNGIIHADLKAPNILFQKTFGDYFTVKLIDFDASFFQNEPPMPPESLCVDQIYMAPECYLYMNELEDDIKLTPKADVFSLGILFHEILSGELPKISNTSEEYDYIFEAVLNNDEIKFNVNILPVYQQLIKKMLKKDVKERFSINQVMEALYKINKRSTPKDIFGEPVIKSKKVKEKDVDNKDSELKGTMVGGKVISGEENKTSVHKSDFTGWSTLNDSDLG